MYKAFSSLVAMAARDVFLSNELYLLIGRAFLSIICFRKHVNARAGFFFNHTKKSFTLFSRLLI